MQPERRADSILWLRVYVLLELHWATEKPAIRVGMQTNETRKIGYATYGIFILLAINAWLF